MKSSSCFLLRRRALWALALFVGCALLFTPSSAHAARYALLIGVSDYDDADVRDLPFCRNDLRALAEALRAAKFDQVHVLSSDGRGDDAATRASILRKLDFLAHKMGKNDTFLLYFSGHGFISEDGSGFLAAQDTNPAQLMGTAISVADGEASLQGKLRSLLPRDVIVMLDACRNRADKSMTGDFVRAAKDLVKVRDADGSYSLLLSCGEGQRSFSFDETETSLSAFTHFVVQGLKRLPGKVSVAAVAEYAEEKTAQWASENGLRQNPVKEIRGRRVVLQENPERPGPRWEPGPPGSYSYAELVKHFESLGHVVAKSDFGAQSPPLFAAYNGADENLNVQNGKLVYDRRVKDGGWNLWDLPGVRSGNFLLHVTVDFRRGDPTSAPSFAIGFRRDEWKSGYIFAGHTDDKPTSDLGVSLSPRRNSQWLAQLGNPTPVWRPRRPFNVVVKALGNRTQIWVDDKQVFDVTDEAASVGTVALGVGAWAEVHFDNFVLCDLG